MVSGFASAKAPPEPFGAIKSVREVVDEHCRLTYEAQKGRMRQYLIAYHLGISPVTLIKMKRRWLEEGKR